MTAVVMFTTEIGWRCMRCERVDRQSITEYEDGRILGECQGCGYKALVRPDLTPDLAAALARARGEAAR